MPTRDPDKIRAQRRRRYIKHKEKIGLRQAEWRAKNPDKVRATSKRSYDKNGPLTETRRAWRKKHPEKSKEISARWKDRNPAQGLFEAALRRALSKGIEITITRDDIIVPECCPIRGVRLVRKSGDDSPSLDRIDATRGYTPDNIWVISLRANMIKSLGTPEEHELVARKVREKLRERKCP